MATLMDLLSSLPPAQLYILASVLVTLVAALIRQKNKINYPANLPRVGEPKGKTSFSLKTRLMYYTNAESLFNEAYHTVNPNPYLNLPGFRIDIA